MEITSFEQWSYDFCGKSMEITLWKINEVLRKYLETMISIKQHWTPWFLKFPCLLSFVMLLPFLFHLRQPRQWTATTSKIMKNHLNICRCLNIYVYIYVKQMHLYKILYLPILSFILWTRNQCVSRSVTQKWICCCKNSVSFMDEHLWMSTMRTNQWFAKHVCFSNINSWKWHVACFHRQGFKPKYAEIFAKKKNNWAVFRTLCHFITLVDS